MEIRTVRRPGEKGTQKLVKQYGERMVCIRYRYDPARKKRFKTVELIVDEDSWEPPPPHPHESRHPQPAPRRFYTQRVGVRVAYHEADLRRQIKAVGGTWDPSRRLWFVPEEHVRRLGLAARIAER
jgi:hypothetical protein